MASCSSESFRFLTSLFFESNSEISGFCKLSILLSKTSSSEEVSSDFWQMRFELIVLETTSPLGNEDVIDFISLKVLHLRFSLVKRVFMRVADCYWPFDWVLRGKLVV